MAVKAVVLETVCFTNKADEGSFWWKPDGGRSIWLCCFDGEAEPTQLLNSFNHLVATQCTRDSGYYMEMFRDIKLVDYDKALEMTIPTEENYDPLIKANEWELIYQFKGE